MIGNMRKTPNQKHARAKFNAMVNGTKKVNRPIIQRGGIKK